MGGRYVELRSQSAFSFLRAAALPEDLVARAAALGLPAFALADRGGLSGAVRAWKAGCAAGVRVLVGAEVDLPGTAGALLLLATNSCSYRHLCRLLTLGHARAGKHHCVVTLAEIEDNATDLICLAGGERGVLTAALRAGDEEGARARSSHLAGLFPGRLRVDLQRGRDARIERRFRKLRDLAVAVGLPIVATGDVRVAGPRESFLLDVLDSIRTGVPVASLGRRSRLNLESDFVDEREMACRFHDLPEALAESVAIAERCEFQIAGIGYRFPEVTLRAGVTPLARLRELTGEGARQRWGSPLPAAVQRQIEHELAVIGRLSLAGYFLVVEDIVRWCRGRGILVQGRGSAASSAVCYALGITAVDPVRMGLLFERFLSLERSEWPDIDLDLPSGEQREAVIQYVYRRFGGEAPGAELSAAGARVAMTANVITWRTRGALREAARALGFPPLEVERLARRLAEEEGRAVTGAAVDLPRLVAADPARAEPASPRLRQLARCVEGLRGLPRHLGQHPGGLVVSAGRLDEVVPIEPATMPGRLVIQWDKEDCADLRMIKIDLLGLGMMAALEEAIPLVESAEGIRLDLARLPMDDARTWQMIQQADTVGVFQIESRAQMATLPRMRPANFYDLVIQIALIRPGPIVGDMVHPYLARRAGREPVRYAHECLRPILERTLGVPLFQEQMLRIAMVAAGFSGGEAEELRRAMGFKRSAERMQALETRLRTGLARRGITGEAAREVVRGIESFAMYGFPESHAASFALIAWASAYLKAHHPAAFLCALLNAWPMGFYHPATLVKDAQRHGVEVRPIDVCASHWRCTLEPAAARPPAVRLGLCFVRGLRREAGVALVAARARQPWRESADLAERVPLTPTELASLAEAGALAALAGRGRRRALWQVLAFDGWGRGVVPAASWRETDHERPLTAARGSAPPAFAHAPSVEAFYEDEVFEFGAVATESASAAVPEFDVGARGPRERDTAGRDPARMAAGERSVPGRKPFEMDAFEETLADYRLTGLTVGPQLVAHLRPWLHARGVLPLAALAGSADGRWVKVGGVVIVRQRPPAAGGCCFVTLEDETAIASGIILPRIYERIGRRLWASSLVVAEGRIERRDGVLHVRIERLEAPRPPEQEADPRRGPPREGAPPRGHRRGAS